MNADSVNNLRLKVKMNEKKDAVGAAKVEAGGFRIEGANQPGRRLERH
jgi:hypothetical protein